MDQPVTTPALPPVTEEAFLADRQRFWVNFTSFAFKSTVAVIVLVVLMAIFLG